MHERDTEPRNGSELHHETVSEICVTPILIRQNSNERLSASLVFGSATISGPGFLLIRTRLSAVSPCNRRNRTSDDGGVANLSCSSPQWQQCCQNANEYSRVVRKKRTGTGCTSLHSWLRWPRCTELHMMIEQPALSKNPSSMITHEETDFDRFTLSALCTLCSVLAASVRNPQYHTDCARDTLTQ